MLDLSKFTTERAVATYLATNGIFEGLFREIRELSKKKPDSTMSAGKVKIINRVLVDLKEILEAEPEGKFLDLLDDNDLPQTSDAVLVMVQYETVLAVFQKKYYQNISVEFGGRELCWITDEFVEEYTGGETD